MELKDKILELIRTPRVAAVASLTEESGLILPAVRHMVVAGQKDLTLIASTFKGSRKVQQIKRNPNVALAIWDGESFSHPYVSIRAKAELHDDLETKKRYWNPSLERFFKGPEDPEYVVVKFVPSRIEYYYEEKLEVWT